ncbi:MAG: HAMP domain-containing sensor histidine kinase, partial [Myxococcota bacterium]
MKQARAIQGALIGFSGGLAIMVVTLALEVYAHEYQIQGGLLKLQRESVAVWVLESIPILLAGAAYVVMSPNDTWRADVNRRARDRKEPDPASFPAPSLPPSPPSAPPVPAVSASNSAPLSGPPSTPSFTAPTGSSTGGLPSGGLAVASSPPPPPVPGKLRKANILGSAGSDQRVKALQELVKTLKEHAAQATDQSRAKSAMLTNLTQELRSPLNQIVGVTEMLVEEAQDPRQSAVSLQADLRRVAGAGRHLVRLINEILDLSRIEVGQLALVLEDVDLAQILEEVRASLGSASSAAIAFHLDAAARMARGDHMRVRQILLTLVRDAAAVSQDGPVTVTLEKGAGGGVEIRVRDSGPALSDDQIARLLERKTQADIARPSDERRGLGLAVSRRLAELMGGGLKGRSDGGRGNEFMVTLPAARIAPEQVRPRSTLALNERLSGMRLVLVDVDAASRSLASYLA